MSKKLIAGAGVVASLAVALAPLATFATVRDTASDKHTDTLKIDVPASCAFGSVSADLVGVAHPTDSTGTNGGKAAWNATTDDKQGLTPDRELGDNENPDPRTRHDSTDAMTAAYTIYAGTKEDNMAQTTLTVYCNDTTQAYTLKAQLNNLTHTDTTTTITPNANYSETASGYAIYSVTKGTNNVGDITSAVSADGSTKFAGTSAAAIAQSPSTGDAKIAANGDSYTIQYGAGVGTSQKAGVYTGTVEYNLYQGI
ncbi:hypothetical protein IKE71_03400 [Candidatus Saccharibacteria bacterium]|nr:hypothetical protein [Candidatus Saccharibacteria bacterium]